MRHVSWIIALVIGFSVGFFSRGALDGRGARPPAGGPMQRPARPVEDARAAYRVPVDDTPLRGSADALVTIVESSDFECPFCKRVGPTLKQLEEAYPGKLRFSFRHNPLPFHARALPAAIATEEARAQGGDAKFWAMHDKLFELAPALDDASIERAAQEVGLDVAKVKEAIASGKHKERIQRDQQLVQSVGAPATPSFFVNGRKIAGAQPLEAFRALVDEELKKAEALVQRGTPASQVYAKIMEGASPRPVFLPADPGQPAGAAPVAPSPAAPAPAALYRKVPLRPDDPARGPADAKLTVVLFSDFQCPFCGRVEPTLKQLEEAYPGQLRIVWKHQPLPMHSDAMPAALAAEAAREQGKFWQLHDKLFENQRALDAATVAGHAKAIGLDTRKFEQAVQSKKYESRIQEDMRLGSSVGANGTPTLFFNCRQVVGAQPLERMRAVADEELKKADALLKGAKPDARFYDRACDANVASAPAAPVPAAAQAPAPGPVQKVDVRPDDPVRGNPKAPVTIVLFSDFQCPFCARVGPTLDEVQRTYGDKVKVVWKHQPLPFHQQALPAAEAAEAAREQGKFWQMHDKLFASQRELSPDAFTRIAREIGLDSKKFQASVQSGKARARIQQDQQLAASVGAQGTPTMFVNGERVVGAVPFEQLKAVIDRQLAKR
ncbi:thioredoxin domain-containing protein [Anaeromyxobacter sp. SG17]|uniref:DsbA family protein n=1 Tax=Anaeromyxobacter sp. SG17 TaxID=2925405 RepID=UPI001F5A9E9A|nr:thioredoxin domain-containing protein [Anaeromyxobacter sp. SG17]